jgi:hypothetical protein
MQNVKLSARLTTIALLRLLLGLSGLPFRARRVLRRWFNDNWFLFKVVIISLNISDTFAGSLESPSAPFANQSPHNL